MKKTIITLIICILMLNLVLVQSNQAINTRENIVEESRAQNKISTGNYTFENQKIQINERANNALELKSEVASAVTNLNLIKEQTENKTKLQTILSNGRNAQIKVMPDKASETAIQILRLNFCSEENNCQIELKEVGKSENPKVAYQVKAQQQARIIGLFKTKLDLEIQIDAETGEIIEIKRPWWSFLARNLN